MPVHLNRMRPSGVPTIAAAPLEVRVVARVPDREARLERIVPLVELELGRDAGDRVPVAVAHGDVDPPDELELAELHVAEIDAVEHRRQRARL